MNLPALLDAPFAVHLHVRTVVPSILLGLWLIIGSRKGTTTHRSAMLGVFIGGILVAGAFAFTPGRILYRIISGS